MRSMRRVTVLLSGFLLCASGLGCAAVDAYVSHSRRPDDQGKSPERLIAIGGILEQQGHLEQADAIYRAALESDPENRQAEERIAHLALLNQTRTFEGGQESASSTVPIRLAGRERTVGTGGSGTLTPSTSEAALLKATATVSIADTEAEDFNDDEATSGLVATDDDSESPSEFDGLVSLETVISRPVIDDEMIQQIELWTEDPEANLESLLVVVRDNPSPEMQAIAAALLAETSVVDPRVNSALLQASESDSAVVVCSACESLLERGVFADEAFERLLHISDHADAGIREQVAAALRRLAGTPQSFAAMEALSAQLNDSDPTVRAMAALTMGDFTDQAEFAIDQLSQRYEAEENESVRQSFELTVERLGGSLRSAEPVDDMPLPFAE